MFGFRKKRKVDDVIGPSTGFMKLAKNFFRFILFPFIYPKRFLVGIIIIVLIIFILPASFGVEFDQMGEWYKQQFNKYFGKTEAFVEEKLMNKPVAEKNKVEKNEVFKKNEIKNVDLVDYDVGVNAKRKLLADDNKIVKFNPNVDSKPINNVEKTEPVHTKRLLFSYKKSDDYGLDYLEKPEVVYGLTEVITPNEIIVNSKKMFLYGTYVVPNTREYVNATKFMYENYEGKNTECKIVAYTNVNVATAVCVCEGESINQKLVDMKFSENIALY